MVGAESSVEIQLGMEVVSNTSEGLLDLQLFWMKDGNRADHLSEHRNSSKR